MTNYREIPSGETMPIAIPGTHCVQVQFICTLWISQAIGCRPNKSLYRKSIAHSLMIPDAEA